MNVLSLIPYNDFTEGVILDPRNRPIVAFGPVKIVEWLASRNRPVEYGYKDRRNGYLKVAVSPEAIRTRQIWKFIISSDYSSEADLYLPSHDHYGNFRVTLQFNRPSKGSFERAALVMNVESDSTSFAVRLTDAYHDYNGLGPENTTSIQWGQRHMRNPLFLEIGPYLFQVGDSLTMSTMDPAELHSAQLRIASNVDIQVSRDDWQEVGRYLGSGSYGEVHVVVGMISGVLRAVKCFAVGATDLRKQRKINAEVDTVTRLSAYDHDNIVKYYGFTVRPFTQNSDETCQLLFQACHGDVETMIGKGASLIHFASIANHLAHALQLLHNDEVNLIHRDIKPANILFSITSLGEAGFDEDLQLQAFGNLRPGTLQFFLSDFGATRIWDESDCWSFVGSLRYLAPEVKGAHRGVYSKSVDIYSLGVTLFDCLDADSVERIYQTHVKQCGWTWEQHSKDRFHLNRYAIALQRMPVPERVQPELWSFLKRMVAFAASERPSITEVVAFFADLIIYRDDPTSTWPLLRFADGKWHTSRSFRMGKASLMPKNLARTAAIASGFPYVPPPRSAQTPEINGIVDHLAQVYLGASSESNSASSESFGEGPSRARQPSPQAAPLSPLFALKWESREPTPSMDWSISSTDVVVGPRHGSTKSSGSKHASRGEKKRR